MILGRTVVTVPEGHAVHVHAPGQAAPLPTGMIADPSAASALAAMNQALSSGQPRPTRPQSEVQSEQPNTKSAKPKKKKRAAKPTEEDDSED